MSQNFIGCDRDQVLLMAPSLREWLPEHQIVIAAELSADSPDFGHLEPMIDATQSELENVGVTETPGVVVADAGYWHQV